MRALVATSLAALLTTATACYADNTLNQGLQYHADSARSGNYVAPTLTWGSAATVHPSTGFAGVVQGNLSAEPLYWRAAAAAHGIVVVATDQNVVQALDASTGVKLWQRTLGPVYTQPTPCGSRPSQGVLGTPFIDQAAGVIYLDAAVAAAPDVRHQVFALSLSTGNVLSGWPIDVASALAAKGMTFVPGLQGQRSGLTLVNGKLYVPFGGNRADCGSYHGWVVGFDVATATLSGAWTSRAPRGGVWGEGGVVTDGQSLFFATGNAQEKTGWADGEAVFRLSPTLQHATSATDYFVPSNFQTMDSHDLDLGATAPSLVDIPVGVAGAGAYIVQLAKDGNAYLLNRSNLGGVGGSIAIQPVSSFYVRGANVTYPAVDHGVMLAFDGVGVNCPVPPTVSTGGVVGIEVKPTAPPTISTSWCVSLSTRTSPMVTTTSVLGANPIVWIVGNDRFLHGYSGTTGASLYAGSLPADRVGGVQVFSTVLAAEGRLFVGGGGHVYAFDYTPNL